MDKVDTFKNIKPYRATKLWNELVVAFRNGITVESHRFHMRMYEKTFTATEAVDWVLRYLRNHDEFGPDISRQQAIQLLQKFGKGHVIEDATSKKKNSGFQDGKKLYRLVTTISQSPAYRNNPRTPLRAVQIQNNQDQSLVLKEHNLLKTKEKPTEINFKLNFETNQEKARPSSAVYDGNPICLPSMPITLSANEMNDAWKSLTWNRLELLLGIETLQDFLNPADVCGKTVRHNATRIDINGIVVAVDKSENLPEWILCAMKCLARWPNGSGSGSCLPKYEGFENDVFRVVKDHFCNSDIPLIPFCLFRLFCAAYVSIANGKLANTTKREICDSLISEEVNVIKNEVCFETAFIEATPVTRLVTSTEHPKSHILSRNEGMVKAHRGNKFTKVRRCVSMECINKGRALRNAEASVNSGSVYSLRPQSSTSNLTSCLSEESLISDVLSNKGSEKNQVSSEVVIDANNSVVLRTLRNFVPKTLPPFYRELNSSCQKRLLKFTQLALLLVPTGQRKQLHLLLRLLKKIVDNKELALFPPGCTQFMLVKTFACSILRPKVISGQDDDVFSCKIVDFILDHCQDAFSQPKELISEVETVLHQHASAKYGCYVRCQSEPAITYCQRVSKEVYEEQKVHLSTQALSELLESIVKDEKLSQKEKQKKLKMFKLQYPEIYERRFPTQSWFELEAARKDKRKTSENSKLTLLERFLNLRF